ncbi:MAG: hypothetical protein EOO92_16200 [Pedobacter sp.]|nr:MAG: hypothetical protein EOO92_16200 [Pedobacter sp.]
MKKLFTLCFIALIAMGSCSVVKLDYIGKTLTPTTTVDMYFNSSDVPKKFEVIGKIAGRDLGLSNVEKIQEKIMAEAKKRGADAVIIAGIGNEFLGTVSQTTSDKVGDKRTITTTNSDSTSPIITADFIKYK